MKGVSGLDAKADAEALRKAMKGLGEHLIMSYIIDLYSECHLSIEIVGKERENKSVGSMYSITSLSFALIVFHLSEQLLL